MVVVVCVLRIAARAVDIRWRSKIRRSCRVRVDPENMLKGDLSTDRPVYHSCRIDLCYSMLHKRGLRLWDKVRFVEEDDVCARNLSAVYQRVRLGGCQHRSYRKLSPIPSTE